MQLFDYFQKTNMSGWVIELAPVILLVWMSCRGVLYNGTDRFPRWCWIVSFAYALLNSLAMFIMTSTAGTALYLDISWQRTLMGAITFFVFFIVAILFLYIAFKIAKKKIEMLSKEE